MKSIGWIIVWGAVGVVFSSRADVASGATEPRAQFGSRGESYPAFRINLLSHLEPFDFGASSGNSCWGYVSSSGREYAIIGLDTGTGFVEVTDPDNPDIVKLINGPISAWRDMKVYQNYNYSVSEGGNGIQVMNLASIDSGTVTLVREVTTGGTSSTHTVALDEVSGYLYRCGGGNEGLRIYSLAVPDNPLFVGEWDDRYVHEAQVVTYTEGTYAGRQIAFCCGGSNGGFSNTGLYVVDVTDKANPVQLSYCRYPKAAYAHQGWLTEDRRYFIINDEFDENEFGVPSNSHVIDVSDLYNTREVSFFSSGSPAIDHNLYILGRYIFESNYNSGLRVFDATDPVHPVQIGFFDTQPDTDAPFYDSLWGNYPFLPSGIVLGSDIEAGLFVWDVGPAMDCDSNGIDDGVDIASGASDVDRNRIPDVCQTVLRVPADYPTLQAAIDAADFGARVVVADGVYGGPGNVDLDFAAKVVSLISENGPEQCVLDGGNSLRLINFDSGDSFGTIVEGFTLQNGKATLGGAVISDRAGGVLRNCVIRNGEADSFGGGVYCSESTLWMTQCSILGNTANDGGGIFIDNSTAMIQNCLIAGNSATSIGGGGIYVRGEEGPSMISHCTLTANDAASNGGGVYVVGGTPLVSNCIIRANTSSGGADFHLAGVGDAVVTYSNVGGGFEGEGNIDTDPMFVDADGADNNPATPEDNDYHLTPSSPCVDQGDPAFVNDPPQTDLDGQSRLNIQVDMGADEFYAAECSADVNGDGLMDPLDAGYVLARLGCPVGTGDADCDAADANEDGLADPLDYGFVLARFGVCEG